MPFRTLFFGLLLSCLVTTLFSTRAEAVPSFARQTGLSCASCHTVFPELTPLGRSFKLNGYTMTGIKENITATNTPAASALDLSKIIPLSFMLQVSGTHTKGETPSTETYLPDELSVFLAGEFTPHIGSFIQMTMEQGTGFSLDNADIRYANHSGALTYGATLNNNPTVQDPWNSTPTWGYPWTHGAEIPGPVVSDGLGQNVAGLGGYGYWDNKIYAELDLYNGTNAFDLNDATDVRVQNPAPYWRLALTNTFGNGDNLMIGTYGMDTSVIDATTYSGPTDDYLDVAMDTQYDHYFHDSNRLLSVHARYTNEQQTLDLSNPGESPTVNYMRVDGTYHWGYHATATLAYAQNNGPESEYDDAAWTAQASYLPWQNIKFTLQYTAYSKLAGLTGSDATDNNTLLLQGWFML
jgi:hypothetical protein